ncbi:MAG: sigma-70 family RNA polymerase sigma factor [Thermoanaerobaculia bacterium]|nr:sigma-70 family RNA polymerase sigma factor [Thermoanaerobaculia bacterium]
MRREERVALVLNVLGGYTQAEVAEHLGVAPGTVGSWLSRGKARLRTSLSTKEQADADSDRRRDPRTPRKPRGVDAAPID